MSRNPRDEELLGNHLVWRGRQNGVTPPPNRGEEEPQQNPRRQLQIDHDQAHIDEDDQGEQGNRIPNGTTLPPLEEITLFSRNGLVQHQQNRHEEAEEAEQPQQNEPEPYHQNPRRPQHTQINRGRAAQENRPLQQTTTTEVQQLHRGQDLYRIGVQMGQRGRIIQNQSRIMQRFDLPPWNHRLPQRVYGLAEEVRGRAMQDMGRLLQRRGRAIIEAHQNLTRSRISVRSLLVGEGQASASTATNGHDVRPPLDNGTNRYPMDARTVQILEELAEYRYRNEDSPVVEARRRTTELILFDGPCHYRAFNGPWIEGQLYFLTDVQSRAVRIIVVASCTNYLRYCGPLEGIWYTSLQREEDANLIQFEVIDQGVPSLWVVHDRNRESATQLFFILERMLRWSREVVALTRER